MRHFSARLLTHLDKHSSSIGFFLCGMGLRRASLVIARINAKECFLGNRRLVEMDSRSEDHRYGSSIEKRRLVSPLLDAMDCGVGQQRMSGDDANLAHNTVRGESRLEYDDPTHMRPCREWRIYGRHHLNGSRFFDHSSGSNRSRWRHCRDWRRWWGRRRRCKRWWSDSGISRQDSSQNATGYPAWQSAGYAANNRRDGRINDRNHDLRNHCGRD